MSNKIHKAKPAYKVKKKESQPIRTYNSFANAEELATGVFSEKDQHKKEVHISEIEYHREYGAIHGFLNKHTAIVVLDGGHKRALFRMDKYNLENIVTLGSVVYGDFPENFPNISTMKNVVCHTI